MKAINEKRTMTLNLNDSDMEALERLSQEKGVSKTVLIRQAIRLYQSLHARLENGEKVYFENPTTKDKAEIVML